MNDMMHYATSVADPNASKENEVQTGTTIVAWGCKDGVVVAAAEPGEA